MTRALRILGVVAIAVAIGDLVHVRNRLLAEQYAIGQAVRGEMDLNGEAARLREAWERESDPLRLRSRAERERGLQLPTSRQVLR